MGFHAVILAGGSGTRLWPLSRAAVPKHLLPLGRGGRTLLRSTVERVLPLGGRIWVVTTAAQADRCRLELQAAGLDGAGVIAEPAARGTGPALGLATAWIAREDPDAVISSVHADAHIGDDEAYRAAVWTGAGWARCTGQLATVGLTPTTPATGLGYIEVGASLDLAAWSPPADGPGALGAPLATSRTIGFVEKPPPALAREYVAGGRHLWNLGLFSWRAAAFIAELRAASEAIADGVEAVAAARAEGDEAGAERRYLALPAEPVDTLVMERTGSLVAVRADFPWSDLGSFDDLAGARRAGGDADPAANVVAGDALVLGARDCLVESGGGRLVAVVGCEGLVVVDTPDALLVLRAERAQEVKEVVEALRRTGRTELL